MKSRVFFISGLTAAFFIIMLEAVPPAENPQPIGEALATIISFGDEYMSSVELYDAKLTVLDVVRGGKALDLLKPVSPSPIPSDGGFECMLVRIRFEFSARSAPGGRTYTLREDQFAAFSSKGKQYPRPAVELTKPILSGTLRTGESLEGWIAFLVEVKEEKPTMVFKEDVQTPLRRGTGLSFRLY